MYLTKEIIKDHQTAVTCLQWKVSSESLVQSSERPSSVNLYVQNRSSQLFFGDAGDLVFSGDI